MDFDLNAAVGVIQQQYRQKEFYRLGYNTGPAYAKIAKRTDMVGDPWTVAIRYGTTQGRGHDFGVAEQNQTPSVFGKWLVTSGRDFSLATITDEAIAKCGGDPGSLIAALKEEMDSALTTAQRNIAIEMFANGGGARGQGASLTSSTVLKLNKASDIFKFELNQWICASTTDGTSGSLLPGRVQIVGINEDTYELTANVAWATGITGFGATNYLFQESDFGQGLKGFPAWLPITDPSSGESFFGQDRSKHRTKLAGVVVASQGNIEETLIEGTVQLGQRGYKPDIAFLNPSDVGSMVKWLSGKVEYDRVEGYDMPDIGFRSVKLIGATGPIDIVGDLNCPKGTGYLLDSSTWYLASAGPLCQILSQDGNKILRVPGRAAYQVRYGTFGQLVCEAPGKNAVLQF